MTGKPGFAVATVLILTLLGAYLVGSFPTGYLMGRARGIDLRSQGSGNIGATNALRVLGKPAGISVLVVDALKGWAGATWVPSLVLAWTGTRWGTTGTNPSWLPVLGGVGAVLGHNFTCWLRFRGGKGIATSAGVLVGVLPMAFLVVLTVFLVVLAVGRIVSLASLAAAVVLPVATWFWPGDPVRIGFATVLALLAIWRHRPNVRRLLEGTEPRIGGKRKSPPGGTGSAGADRGHEPGAGVSP